MLSRPSVIGDSKGEIAVCGVSHRLRWSSEWQYRYIGCGGAARSGHAHIEAALLIQYLRQVVRHMRHEQLGLDEDVESSPAIGVSYRLNTSHSPLAMNIRNTSRIAQMQAYLEQHQLRLFDLALYADNMDTSTHQQFDNDPYVCCCCPTACERGTSFFHHVRLAGANRSLRTYNRVLLPLLLPQERFGGISLCAC